MLTFEIPQRQLGGGRCYRGDGSGAGDAVEEAAHVLCCLGCGGRGGDVRRFVTAWAVRRAQRSGRYDPVPGMRLVTAVTRGMKPKVRWRELNGAVGERELNLLTWQERMLLFEEGPHGPEPLWLWLNEHGLPFRPHSWEGVFRAAMDRIADGTPQASTGALTIVALARSPASREIPHLAAS